MTAIICNNKSILAPVIVEVQQVRFSKKQKNEGV